MTDPTPQRTAPRPRPRSYRETQDEGEPADPSSSFIPQWGTVEPVKQLRLPNWAPGAIIAGLTALILACCGTSTFLIDELIRAIAKQ